jgi:hypothetical protein
MAKWTDPVSAAADFLGNGAIEINKYESEIVDIIRRSSTALQRFSKKPATGHPHRYFDQTAIATGAFSDPRTIAVSATSPTRTERAAMIKAITAQTNVGLFDVDVTRMQGQFAQVEAQDIADITSAVIVTEAAAVWAGTDTSLSTPTTTQYMACSSRSPRSPRLLSAPRSSMASRRRFATMVANQTYVIRPTAIYLNPQLADFIDREAKGQKIDMDRMEVVGGVMVNAIMTQAGLLPLIPEPFVPATTDTSYGFTAPTGGTSNYFAVIVTENLIEMPYVHGGDGNPNPRLFQLGLVSNLQGQFVAVHFNTIIAKLAGTAHAVVCVNR